MVRMVPTLMLVLALLVAGSMLRAQPGTSDLVRRDLIARATEARAAGNHAEALALAERAAQIRSTPSLAYLLAQEHEALGHHVRALDWGRRCLRDAEADQGLRGRAELLEGCRSIVSDNERQVGRITLRVPDPPPAGLSVRVAGEQIERVVWGVALPVEPGQLEVEAGAQDGRTFRRVVHVVAGQLLEVEVIFGSEASGGAAPQRSSTRAASNGPGAGPWIVAGLGVAGLVGSLVLWQLAAAAQRERDGICTEAGVGPCDDRDRAIGADESYRRLLIAADVVAGVGGVALGVGVLWLLVGLRGQSHEVHRPPRAAVVPLPGGVLLELGGAL